MKIIGEFLGRYLKETQDENDSPAFCKDELVKQRKFLQKRLPMKAKKMNIESVFWNY